MSDSISSHVLSKISVAPMMGWTDKHCRYFHRLISPHTLLYTVMLTTGALIHGNARYFLEYNAEEHPVALQLGGSDPKDLATCAQMAEDYGYDEVNLNCGCPSDRVQRGSFGACLMAEPDLVAECINEMQNAVKIPVTVKCRIAIDDFEEEPFLHEFIQKVRAGGCRHFIIHARKAWLKGLSPKENRDIPPLNYDLVHEIKAAYDDISIGINGGIKTVNEVQTHLKSLETVMIGREAYHNPYLLADIESEIFGNDEILSRMDVIEQMLPYIEQMNGNGVPVKDITRHMLGLFKGQPGAQIWRRYLSENTYHKDATVQVVKDAIAEMLAVYEAKRAA
jgi:tRNA-dihydrouridine synthase A